LAPPPSGEQWPLDIGISRKEGWASMAFLLVQDMHMAALQTVQHRNTRKEKDAYISERHIFACCSSRQWHITALLFTLTPE